MVLKLLSLYIFIPYTLLMLEPEHWEPDPKEFLILPSRRLWGYCMNLT